MPREKLNCTSSSNLSFLNEAQRLPGELSCIQSKVRRFIPWVTHGYTSTPHHDEWASSFSATPKLEDANESLGELMKKPDCGLLFL